MRPHLHRRDDEHPYRNPCQPISSAATRHAGITPAYLLSRAGPGGSAARAYPAVALFTRGSVGVVNMSVALRALSAGSIERNS